MKIRVLGMVLGGIWVVGKMFGLDFDLKGFSECFSNFLSSQNEK